jgi:NAD(P)-dependent dehydrogenase (short-subunit alcohol dehydrogenase family)
VSSAQQDIAEPCDRLFDLAGRVAVVTGAGQGVGAGIARRLAEFGAIVAVNDLHADRACAVKESIRAAGGHAHAIAADVTDRNAFEHSVREVVAAEGRIDILVNNAGVPPTGMGMTAFVDTSPADWETMLRLNLYAVMYCTHAVLPLMIERQWGRVISIGSDAGRFGDPLLAAYCAAKAGSAGFTRAISKEVGRHGITVNTVSLGSMVTPHFDDPDAERRARRYPMKRLGLPDDVAGAAVWLASEQAGWVTGQTISINGGYVGAP